MNRTMHLLGIRIVLAASFTLFICVSGAPAQAKPTGPFTVEAELVAKEKLKWDAIKNGRWNDLKDMFADEYQSIGYRPDGSVRMVTKAQSFAPENKLPAGFEFVLSDFKVIFAGKDSAVVSYLAEGPIKIHATSVWAKRAKEWRTIFYQATMTK